MTALYGRETMDETLGLNSNAGEAGELETLIAQIVAEIDQRRAQMREDQTEIDRLKAESRQLQAETVALLAGLQATS
jgi:uncharacterized small protein (DUF1192 family)